MCKDNMEMSKKKVHGVMDRMNMDTFAEETEHIQHHGVMDRMNMDTFAEEGDGEPTVIPAKENFSFKKVFRKEKNAPVQEEPIQRVPIQRVEKIARLDKQDIRDNFADERKNAYQQVLLDSCEADLKLVTDEGCREILAKVQEYARLNRDVTEDEMQKKVLVVVRKELKRKKEKLTAQRDKLVEKGAKNLSVRREKMEEIENMNRDLEILRRYSLFFKCTADGYLQEKEINNPLPKAQIVDGTKNIKLPFGISWKDMKDEPLFPHEPTLNDIQQGCVGDCYFQAAMADMVVSEPEKLKECMRDNGDGTVTVRLFQEVKSVEGHPRWGKFAKAIEEKERISDFSEPEELMKLLYVAFSKENALEQDKWSTILLERIKKTPEYIAGYNAKGNEQEKKNYENTEEAKVANLMYFVFQIFEKKELLLKDSNKGYEFANELAEDARLAKFFGELKKWQKHNPRAKCTQDTFTEIVKLFMDNVDLADIKKIDDEQYRASGYNANRKIPGETETIPYYVTVKKEIPVQDGSPYYSNGAMWAHMLQKAYVASGIHKDRLVPKKATYQDIAAGLGNDAISMLTGKRQVRLFQKNVTAKTFGSWITSIKAAEKTQNPQIPTGEIDAYEKLLECLDDKIKATRLKTYTPNGTKTQDTYAKEALTIESVMAEMRTLLHWEREAGRNEKQKEKFTVFMEVFQKAYPHLTEEQTRTEIENFVEKYTNILQTRLENKIGWYQLQHERFMEKTDEHTGEKVGLYTQNALDIYGKIQDALQKRKPIGAGSQHFTPDEVESAGLNGEAMDGGFVEGHDYTIVGCKEIDGHKYIRLRNPWANTGHGYKKITTLGENGTVKYELKKIDKKGKKDGQFLIELNDFLNRVNLIYGIQL